MGRDVRELMDKEKVQGVDGNFQRSEQALEPECRNKRVSNQKMKSKGRKYPQRAPVRGPRIAGWEPEHIMCSVGSY